MTKEIYRRTCLEILLEANACVPSTHSMRELTAFIEVHMLYTFHIYQKMCYLSFP